MRRGEEESGADALSDATEVSRERLLLTVDEVAARLGVSRKTVLRENLRGHLPQPLRIGRCLRWSAQELSLWVTHGCPARNKWSGIWDSLREKSVS